MSDGIYIIVKSYFSYDGGGPPVGVYGKVASRSEDGVAHATYIYLRNT